MNAITPIPANVKVRLLANTMRNAAEELENGYLIAGCDVLV
jgi:hypothetical protein